MATVTARFVTFEGGEGAGKSTQARLLVEALRQRGVSCLLTREPGGAPGSEALRHLLLNGGIEWSPLAETLLHFSARAEHVQKTIRPALQRGEWVICDRYFDSTRAYQGAASGIDGVVLDELQKMIGLTPDLTIMLDLPDEKALARVAERGEAGDRYEQRPPAFHARVNQAFRDIARQEARCVLLSADRGINDVQMAIHDAIRQRLGIAL